MVTEGVTVLRAPFTQAAAVVIRWEIFWIPQIREFEVRNALMGAN